MSLYIFIKVFIDKQSYLVSAKSWLDNNMVAAVVFCEPSKGRMKEQNIRSNRLYTLISGYWYGRHDIVFV